MDIGLTIMLIGALCFTIGVLDFRYTAKKMRENPDYNPKDQGCFGSLFTFLLFFGVVLILLGMTISGNTGSGDPSYAPNWRGR